MSYTQNTLARARLQGTLAALDDALRASVDSPLERAVMVFIATRQSVGRPAEFTFGEMAEFCGCTDDLAGYVLQHLCGIGQVSAYGGGFIVDKRGIDSVLAGD